MTEQRADLSTRTLAAAGTEHEAPAEQSKGGASDPKVKAQDPAKQQSTKHDAAGADLLPAQMSTRFREKWEEIQTGFVDEPRRSVEHADQLVADLMQRLAASFSDERSRLENQWDRGDDVSTEDLRVALTRYRSFFERLLSA